MIKKLNNDAEILLPEILEIEASEVLMEKDHTPASLLFEESKTQKD